MNRHSLIALAVSLFGLACIEPDDPDEPQNTADEGALADDGVLADRGVLTDRGVLADEGFDASPCVPPQCPEGMLIIDHCIANNPNCIEIEGCGETLVCVNDVLPCPIGYTLGGPGPCLDGDSQCVDGQDGSGAPVQCLDRICNTGEDLPEDEIEDNAGACPDDPNVRVCAECADPLPWCGQLWPSCEIIE